MRKFNFLIGAVLLLGGMVRAQEAAKAPLRLPPRYLGTKTPYVVAVGAATSPPAGFRPVFINYVGRHGARFMTKAGADIEALQLLELAASKQGLTAIGLRVKGVVQRLYAIEKGRYENITLLGAEEQQAIGQRMFSRYRSVFTGKGLDVVVTYKVRTQQSADGFLRGLAGYAGPRRFSKLPDSLDAVLRFYDLSPVYQQYKKSAVLKKAFDSLDRDHRTAAAAAAVCERVFAADFRGGLKVEEELRFVNNLYDLYSLQFSVSLEAKSLRFPADSVDLGVAFGEGELAWEDFVSGAQDFLEKGPAADPLGIQVKVAAPLLVDFVRAMDGVVGSPGASRGAAAVGRGAAGTAADAVLRFTHAEAISPFATLLGIPEASVPSAGVYNYHEHWQAEKIIPLSANIQWIVYSDGREYLVKVLLNEREVLLPVGRGFAGAGGAGGPYYRWEDLRAYCLGRLKAVGADLQGDQLDYLKKLR